MIIHETIQFDQNSIDTSIENYLKLCTVFSSDDSWIYNNTRYLIIMKYLISYLKQHPESNLWRNFQTHSLLYEIESACYYNKKEIRYDIEFISFKSLKMEQYNTQINNKIRDDERGINYEKEKMLKTWFLVEQVIKQFEEKLQVNQLKIEIPKNKPIINQLELEFPKGE